MHIFMGVMCSRNLGWFGKVLRSVLGFEKSFGKNENREVFWWGSHLKSVVCIMYGPQKIFFYG